MEKEIGKICSLIGKGGRLSVAEEAFIRVKFLIQNGLYSYTS
jgi:hypothetical protein